MGNSVPIHRFVDAGEEPNQILVPIEGYEKKQLVPLYEAVEPIKQLLHNLDIMVVTALRNSEEPPDALTIDESAAIHLYTMQWSDSHNSLYELINQTLRSEKRNDLKPWFSYLKLILTALHKLPPLQKTIWRAIHGEVDKQYKKDKIWWGFSSCTETQEITEQFIGCSGVRTLFKINCINGRSVRPHSYFKNENEILLMPGTYLRVLNKSIKADGLHLIELQEEEPPYQLITPPSGKQATISKLDIKDHRPSCDPSPKKNLARKHIRYIPYNLVGMHRCPLAFANGKCPKRDPEHMIVFHSNDHDVQERWGSLPQSGTTTYFGFHMITAPAAVAIAHSDFRRSLSPPQMLGFGVYFARSSPSFKRTDKDDYALICAEVHMGRVLQVTRDQISTVCNSNAWWEHFDTVYYSSEIEKRDEFCIKDPEQIIRWVIAVD